MIVDPLELKLIAIDGRFSELGFKGRGIIYPEI